MLQKINGKNYRQKYDNNLKRRVGSEYLSGGYSYQDLAVKYDLLTSGVVREFVKWYRKNYDISVVNEKPLDEMSEIEKNEVKVLQDRIHELEKKLSKSSLKIESLETVIDIAEREYKFAIRKKSGTERSVN